MNIISYDIELTRKSKRSKSIIDYIQTAISKHYEYTGTSSTPLTDSWNNLRYKEFRAVNSAEYLLTSFIIETVQVFLFKKETKNIVGLNELTITVIAISTKEINLILKSSFNKICSIFDKELEVKVIEGTNVNIYPFDTGKNDVLSPDFFIKANYNKNVVNLSKIEIIKLCVFLIITTIFIIIYFTTPSEVADLQLHKNVPNNLKSLYGALMSTGISFIIIDMIANLMIPYAFRPLYPIVHIENFSNIFENNIPSPVKTNEILRDPDV